MNKANKVTLSALIILIGFIISTLVAFINGVYLDKGEPYDSFLCNNGSSAFCDYFDMVEWSSAPYAIPYFAKIYLPFGFLIYRGFSIVGNLIGSHSVVFFLLFSLCFLALIYINKSYLYDKTLNKIVNFQNLFIFSCLSYPFLFALERGNSEFFLFILTCLFISLFYKRKYLLASILLGVIASTKMVTFSFALLFLFRKKYKEIFYVFLIVGFLNFISLNIFDKAHFWDQIAVYIKNLKLYQLIWVKNEVGVWYSCCYYGALIFIITAFNLPINKGLIYNLYGKLNFLFYAILAFFAYSIKQTWKRLFIITSIIILLPISQDYRLLYFFIPFYYFVNSKPQKTDLFYLIGFSLIFIPKAWNYITILKFNGTATYYWSWQVLINPIIIIIMLLFMFFNETKNKLKNKKQL